MLFRAAILTFALAATPAFAAHYTAEPAAKPVEARFALRDVLWTCGDAGCTGGKSNSRPAIVCAVLAREVGSLTSFRVAGEALTPEQLEKCNARTGAQFFALIGRCMVR